MIENSRWIWAAAASLTLMNLPMAAHAEGVGAEINYGRADGHWGTEIGAGYALDVAGFSLRPGGGVYLREGGTKLYGRVEATYALPATVSIGAGVRFSGENTRPYATIAMPLIPKLHAKVNVSPKYYGVGLTLGY